MKTIKKYLFDIKTSINSIEEYVDHVDTFEMYQENKLIRRAVEREKLKSLEKRLMKY